MHGTVVVDATTVGTVFLLSLLFVDGFVIVVGANVTVDDILPCETLNVYVCTPLCDTL